MEVSDFLKQSFLGWWYDWDFPSITIITKVMAFRQNSLTDRKSLTLQGANKDKRQGEVIVYRSYSSKYHIPSSINRDDFNNHPEKPRTIGGLRLQGCRSYDKPNVGEAAL
jgi:hypothetical protein